MRAREKEADEDKEVLNGISQHGIQKHTRRHTHTPMRARKHTLNRLSVRATLLFPEHTSTADQNKIIKSCTRRRAQGGRPKPVGEGGYSGETAH